MKKSIIIMLSMSLFLTCDINADWFKSAKKTVSKKTSSAVSSTSNSLSSEQALYGVESGGIFDMGDAMEVAKHVDDGNDEFSKGNYHDALRNYVQAVACEYRLGGAPAGQPTKDELWDKISRCLDRDYTALIQLSNDIDTYQGNFGSISKDDKDYMDSKASSICYDLGMTRLNQKHSDGSPMYAVSDYVNYFTTAQSLNSDIVYPDAVQDYIDSLPAS